ncbi:MAG: bifunctional diaminohydroxyphosphoribosylaminopyrimidine deaminase/5-amino-6-(5-phosphoribosylamino)uracil reductase RibD [Planctomycetota bacterium]
MAERDEAFMRLALRLAARGRGKVEPNPMVGCVAVRDGEVVGKGYHRRYGGPHAEVNAVRDAGGDVAGATVYVTLEPCVHTGKTLPCVDLLIEQRPACVVVAMRDPFPEVAGRGVRALRRAGISVEVGLLDEDARELNAPYLKRVETGLPYVIAKWAMTLDGKIATSAGDSKWITSDEARRYAHRVRGRMDAVIVGIGTALADDPELTCRLARPRREAKRVVLDSRARLPAESKLARSARDVPVVVAATGGALAKRTERLMRLGCRVVELPQRQGRVDVTELLAYLGEMGMTNVLVEGGAETLGSFFGARQVDEVMAFVGPRVLGGPGLLPVAGEQVARIADAVAVADLATHRLGDSILLHGRVRMQQA